MNFREIKKIDELAVMENSDWAHLHVHTEFSALDGYGSAENYAKYASELGFEYLAITDHGNIDGSYTFQKACLNNGIKPIIGSELYIVPNLKDYEKSKQRGHITLWVKNDIGWKNLCKMITISNTKGFYYKPRIDFDILWENLEGLVFGSACAASFLWLPGGIEFAEDLWAAVGDDFYFELMPHDFEKQYELWRIIKDCKRAGIDANYLLTNDAHYIKSTDSKVQEVLLAIQSQSRWNDPTRWRFEMTGLHLRDTDEMIIACEDFKYPDSVILSGLKNTKIIAKKCEDFKIKTYSITLPKSIHETSETHNADEILEYLCFDGYRNLFGGELDNNAEYYSRFVEEFELIKSKKFARYFLMVNELVVWCERNDILVGPGRGSVGGSLIAYLLKITKVNPIEFGLLFVRFLSPERNDFPDIDLDFEDRKRESVIAHLKDRYGHDHVAGVATYLRMKSRLIVKDVARVFDVSFDEVNEFTSLIDSTAKSENGLIDLAINSSDVGMAFRNKYPEVISISKKLEGQIRGGSKHAAAIIISNESLYDGSRCSIVRRGKDEVVNWEGGDCERMGLMKLDVLGLSTLSVLSEAVNLVRQNIKNGQAKYGFYFHPPSDSYFASEILDLNSVDDDIEPSQEFALELISLEDVNVLKKFAQGNNSGIFQFNSSGMERLASEMKIKTFEDIVAANALYRPGPLRSGMASEYVERRRGKRYDKIHPIVDEITKNTKGIIIYQEQVMFIANRLAGIPWGETDKIRKVIGKSKGDKELSKFSEQFISGCTNSKRLTRKQAEKLWKEIETFGGYGFNRSHAVEYSIIAYWCQYIKNYWPAEYMAAYLTYGSNDSDKKAEMVSEVNRIGLSIIPPKVGISDPYRWIADGNRIYIPFIEVKGIGEKTAQRAAAAKKPKQGGFFNKKKSSSELKGIPKILMDIHAFSPEKPLDENSQMFFDFKINTDLSAMYPNLYRAIGNKFHQSDFKNILCGELNDDCYGYPWIKKKSLKVSEWDCNDCELRDEALYPIMTQPGEYNVFIIGEAPEQIDDKNQENFSGDSADILFEELERNNMNPNYFHYTNICRCYPSLSGKPIIKHIKKCKPNILSELKAVDTRLILLFGNTGLKFALGESEGIYQKSGTVRWVDELSAWVVFCVSPVSCSFQKFNKIKFKESIEKFANMFYDMK